MTKTLVVMPQKLLRKLCICQQKKYKVKAELIVNIAFTTFSKFQAFQKYPGPVPQVPPVNAPAYARGWDSLSSKNFTFLKTKDITKI